LPTILETLFKLYVKKCMKDSPFTFRFPLSKRYVYPKALFTVPNTCSTIFCLLLYSSLRTYSNGTLVGDLVDGRIINIHPSTSLGGMPSLEIYNPLTGDSIKIRY
jgi:hypothetical protein